MFMLLERFIDEVSVLTVEIIRSVFQQFVWDVVWSNGFTIFQATGSSGVIGELRGRGSPSKGARAGSSPV